MLASLKKLVEKDAIAAHELASAVEHAETSGRPIADVLMGKGVSKWDILLSLEEHYGVPFIEFDEDLIVSYDVMKRVDPEELKQRHWLPISIKADHAEVIASRPNDSELLKEIQSRLGVEKINFRVALPSDIVRIIENNQDLNPGFPRYAGRTPLARSRTYMAGVRSALALQRTAMAKARTGLTFIRAGISSVTIAITLLELFGANLLLVDVMLLVVGVFAVLDGLWWYIPIRGEAMHRLNFAGTHKGPGMTVLHVENEKTEPEYLRTGTIEGAEEMRRNWERLSPVMRRRFLANDRCDLAEVRTKLASMRNTMARTRTGLSFSRTGAVFAGLGLGLTARFPDTGWMYLGFFLIISGSLMALEGFYWYLPGYREGLQGIREFKKAMEEDTIWDLVFPAGHGSRHKAPPVKSSHAPGIWGTTGLATERTVLAERRGLMAFVRTVLAYSRTGLAFLRTGVSLATVGAALLVLLMGNGIAWKIPFILLVAVGLLLVADGLRWCLSAEKMRREHPYYESDFELNLPDYGKPARQWGRVVFSDDF